MAVLSKLFHKHERGMGNEDWHWLCRDTDSGRVFVRHWWSHRTGLDGPFNEGQADLAIEEFLNAGKGSLQNEFLSLIGGIPTEEYHAPGS